MGAKKILQTIIGKKTMAKLAVMRRNLLHVKGILQHKVGTVSCVEGIEHIIYEEPGKNLFFGYYDLAQINMDGDRMLAHIVKKNADPSVDDANLVLIDIKTKNKTHFASTKAWSWQQGARLRWHPVKTNHILYNDIDGGHYVTKEYDANTGTVKVISDALYDIDSKFEYGISVNFERLQRLRHGYGYSRLSDTTANIQRPNNDGVFRINLATGKKQLLFSLEELAQGINDNGEHHYINHVCFSPSGEKFMFFHLWAKDAKSPWGMRFYVCNSDGSGLIMLEDNVRISHYHWIGEDRIIATREVKGKEYEYIMYNITEKNSSVIKSNMLNIDGHPNAFRDGFVTDTYPQKNNMQYVFTSNFDGTECREIMHLYADPICFGEHRCDLHPRVYGDHIITIDTTANGSVRSVLYLTVK